MQIPHYCDFYCKKANYRKFAKVVKKIDISDFKTKMKQNLIQSIKLHYGNPKQI